MLSTTATLTGAVHLAYFGKAGVENYKKIEQSCAHGHSDDEESEG